MKKIEDPMYFGAYIRNARIDAGMSLRELAKRLDISHVYIGEIERGVKAALPESRWKKLVKALPAITLKDLDRWEQETYCETCYRRLPMEFRV